MDKETNVAFFQQNNFYFIVYIYIDDFIYTFYINDTNYFIFMFYTHDNNNK